MPKEAYRVIDLNGDSPEKSKAALEAIFSDPHTLACMEASLKNTDKSADRNKEKHRRLEALEAFSQNSPEFWDMTDE